MSIRKKGRVTGVLLFILMMLTIVYFSVFSANVQENKISVIELSGNNYLSREQYIKFSKLNNISDYKFLSLAVIKDRLEKHPYVLKADVEHKGNGEVSVEIVEKKFKALVLSGNDQYLITESFQLSPVMPLTRNIDLPVISNPLMSKKIKRFEAFRTPETITAFKIIDAALLVNNDLYGAISEINLRNGHDIILTLSGCDFPIVFGRREEARKIVYLNSIWSKISSNKATADQFISYIDLRFEKLIYVGMTDVNNNEKAEVEEVAEGNKG